MQIRERSAVSQSLIKARGIAQKTLLIPLIVLLATVCGCSQPKSAHFDPVAQTSTPGPAEDSGTSSGGGNFGDESSLFLLNTAKQRLAMSLRTLNPKSLEYIPGKWSAEKIARTIESIKLEPNKVVYRYGRELMFDNATYPNGKSEIIATSLFFRSHASIPVTSLSKPSLEPYIREITIKLLHETGHLLGIGLTEKTNYKARVFAMIMLESIIENNILYCKAADVPESYYLYLPGGETRHAIKDSTNLLIDPKNYRFIISPSTGLVARIQPGAALRLNWLVVGLWDIVSKDGSIQPTQFPRDYNFNLGSPRPRDVMVDNFAQRSFENNKVTMFGGRAWNDPNICSEFEEISFEWPSRQIFEISLRYSYCTSQMTPANPIVTFKLRCWQRLVQAENGFSQLLGDAPFEHFTPEPHWLESVK